MIFNITSNYGHLHFGSFYIGWANYDEKSDGPGIYVGDEIFGISIGRVYAGNYGGTGWCLGILDQNGCLPD